jgi:hypothetical protein
VPEFVASLAGLDMVAVLDRVVAVLAASAPAQVSQAIVRRIVVLVQPVGLVWWWRPDEGMQDEPVDFDELLTAGTVRQGDTAIPLRLNKVESQ